MHTTTCFLSRYTSKTSRITVFLVFVSFLVHKSEVRNSSSCDGEYTPTSHPNPDLNQIIINYSHIIKLPNFCNFQKKDQAKLKPISLFWAFRISIADKLSANSNNTHVYKYSLFKKAHFLLISYIRLVGFFAVRKSEPCQQ